MSLHGLPVRAYKPIRLWISGQSIRCNRDGLRFHRDLRILTGGHLDHDVSNAIAAPRLMRPLPARGIPGRAMKNVGICGRNLEHCLLRAAEHAYSKSFSTY